MSPTSYQAAPPRVSLKNIPAPGFTVNPKGRSRILKNPRAAARLSRARVCSASAVRGNGQWIGKTVQQFALAYHPELFPRYPFLYFRVLG